MVTTAPLDLTLPSSEIARALCDVPSVSGEETHLADLVEDALRERHHLTVTRDGDAVVASTALGRPTRVVVAGHLDTVPIHDNVPSRIESRPDGEWLVGRGTVDMKSGDAILLKLAAELENPDVDVTWVFYDHEEVAASLNGLGRLARNRPELLQANFAVLGEPTAGRVEGGCNGTCRFIVTTRGRRAHSARSWVGVNAIHAALPVLQTLVDEHPGEVEVEGLRYREGLNAVRIAGGVAGNVIPDECRIEVNYRFAPSRDEREVRSYVERVFGRWDVEFVDFSLGARPGLDAPLAQSLASATGHDPLPKYGWTDVARFSALGIPAVNFGPGDALKAHADDEEVRLAEIERCESILRSWLLGQSSHL